MGKNTDPGITWTKLGAPEAEPQKIMALKDKKYKARQTLDDHMLTKLDFISFSGLWYCTMAFSSTAVGDDIGM